MTRCPDRVRRAAAGLGLIGVLALAACTTSGPSVSAPVAAPVSATPVAAVSTPTQTPTATTAASSTPTTTVAPAPLLAAGATGDQVRELQARLKQIKSYTQTVDGVFADTTTSAVQDFQTDFDLPVTGTVDQPMWNLLLATTAQPSAEELAGHLIPGPALMAVGATGATVRELQARLKQLGRWTGDVTSTFGPTTATAVKGYQTKRGLPVTGEVDQRTKDRIWSQTRKPTSDELNNVKPAPAAGLSAAGLDARCLTGRVLCASKAGRFMYWLIDGVPQARFDVRFGTADKPTANGVFSVYWKDKDHVSTTYNNAPMPYSMFF